MKIAQMTTWLQQCGIASYSANLAAHLRPLGVDVLILAEKTDSPRTDAPIDLSGIEVSRCWDRKDPRYPTEVVRAAKDWKPDIIHLQHEYGLFPDRGAFLRLLIDLRKIAPLVITPHTITPRAMREYAWIWSHLKTRRAEVVCHTTAGRRVLVDEYLYPGRWTRHIPHASPDPAQHRTVDQATARLRLGLPLDRVVLASIGFIGLGKRQDATLTAINDAVDAGLLHENDLWFVIAGAPGGGWDESDRYLQRLESAIRDFGLDGCCEIRRGFVPFDDFTDWFSAIDCAINLSTENGCFSASGRIRIPAAYGCPQIVEMVNLHRDLETVVEPVPTGNGVALMQSIARVVRDKRYRDKLGARGQAYARATAWPKIARLHSEMYEETR